jgi:hypothetical protein
LNSAGSIPIIYQQEIPTKNYIHVFTVLALLTKGTAQPQWNLSHDLIRQKEQIHTILVLEMPLKHNLGFRFFYNGQIFAPGDFNDEVTSSAIFRGLECRGHVREDVYAHGLKVDACTSCADRHDLIHSVGALDSELEIPTLLSQWR